jgi:hypothetical protein
MHINSKSIWAFALIGGLVLLCTEPAAAWTTFRVSTTDQLIWAMKRAEQSDEPTAISVAPGHYLFTQVFNSSYGGSALPNVTKTILIVGADPATTIFDLGGLYEFLPRFFTVLSSGNLELRNLTLTGAGGTGACDPFSSQDCSDQGGGAILNIRGVLTIINCVLSGNKTSSGPGFGGLDGGAILSVSGILTIDDTTIEGNGAEGYGGGIALHGGSASISHSIIRGNGPYPGAIYDGSFFALLGGGIFVSSGEMNIDSSTISGNSAGLVGAQEQSYGVYGLGGGIYNGGSILLTNSAVIDNTVTDYGGGGGIYNAGGMKIENSTIAQNVAGTLGGGIFNANAMRLQGVTLTENNVLGNILYGFPGIPPQFPSYPPGCGGGTPTYCYAGDNGLHSDPGANTQIATSVLANNNGSDCGGIVISDGHNALGTDSGCTWKKSESLQGHGAYDQINVNPLFGALQDNGAPGNAHYPLLPGSPLIDAGGPIGSSCTPLDQIGDRRIDGDADHDGTWICDIGAIEYRPSRTP